MEEIGIRELKDGLSALLRRVREGQTIRVMDRKEPVALIVPIRRGGEGVALEDLVDSRLVSWSGGKPTGTEDPPAVRGPSVADAVIEDRR